MKKKNWREIKSQVKNLIQKDTPKLMNESKNTHQQEHSNERITKFNHF